MTNSEAIEELRSRKLTMSMCIDIESCRNANNAIDMSISALEENTKLKAEIERLSKVINALAKASEKQNDENEQLKSELEQWQSTNFKLVCELTRVECENNQLKSELEQLSKQYSNVESMYHKYYNLYKKGQVEE